VELTIEKKIDYVWLFVCSSFYASLLILCISSYTLNILDKSTLIEFRYDRIITIISLAYFSILLIVSLQSNKMFWFLLPFVVLTVPNAVNSIFPGFFLTHQGERGNASFSFISHIDLYLISNFLINVFRDKRISIEKESNFKLLKCICLFLTIGLLYRSFDLILNGKDFIYALNGAFHFRYTFLILLISYQLTSKVNEKSFTNGLLLSIPVLALESVISTHLAGASLIGELRSGNFANNVFGNFLAFLFIYLFILKKEMTLGWPLHVFICTLLFILIIMTGVRGAIISLVLGFIAYFFFIRVGSIKLFSYVLLLLLSSVGLLFAFDLEWISEYISVLIESFTIVLQEGYGADGIKIDDNNSSLITRIAIWKGTFLMAIDYWFFGVGASQWNYLKEAYNIPFKVLLDPHNDYLNFFCLYGIPGLLFIYAIYIKPVKSVLFNKVIKNINPYQLSLFTLCISSLTNANNSKHQVFAIVIIFVVLSINFEINSNKKLI
jgi:O-antigen ligase